MNDKTDKNENKKTTDLSKAKSVCVKWRRADSKNNDVMKSIGFIMSENYKYLVISHTVNTSKNVSDEALAIMKKDIISISGRKVRFDYDRK